MLLASVETALASAGQRKTGEGRVLVEFERDFRILASDALCLCGSEHSLDRCQRQLGTVGAAAPHA